MLKDALSIALFVALVLVGTLLINNFVFRSYSVEGPSMEQTLYTGDRLIVNRLPATWANLIGESYLPKRGEIIVFKNPSHSNGAGDKFLVKRVLAFEGERVVVRGGTLTIYNEENPDGFNPDESEFYSIDATNTSGNLDLTVPRNEIFVAGDHRDGNYSHDSRNGLGTVPLYDIVGPVSLRIFPFNKLTNF